MKAFTNCTIYTGSEVLRDHVLLIEYDEIKAVVHASEIPSGVDIIDCKGCSVAPGLIDLQIYGGGGYLFSNRPSVEALHAMTNAVVRSGTTSFMLTLATNAMEVFREAIRIVKHNHLAPVLGLHLEGPYLNPEKRGAHILEYIKKPEPDEVQSLMAEGAGIVKMITLAPELTDASIIDILNNHGVLISAGHSNATFEEAKKGFNHGIRAVTHLFNAMSPLHHRNTGLPGAAYQNQNICASIIADGIHVDYQAVSISKKVMKERLFLITDAVEENLEGAYVHIRHQDCFRLPDGTLSGSNLTLMQAVRNCVEHVHIPLDEALRMASTYPAALINANNIGKIEPGYKANLILFDHKLEVRDVYLNGKLVDQ